MSLFILADKNRSSRYIYLPFIVGAWSAITPGSRPDDSAGSGSTGECFSHASFMHPHGHMTITS
jgi:hypothetical protein